jgi:hypothetical protein
MITLKDLHLLINHLHQANEIFDAEATIEERKHKEIGKNITHERRTQHEPRSVVLHHKATLVNSIEKKLLQECDTAIVTLEENTIYAARELIAESVYPWLHRKEPPLEYIKDLLADETFIPFSHGLTEKKKKLLDSGIHLLILPLEIEKELSSHFTSIKAKTKKDVTTTVGDIFSFGIENLHTLFPQHTEYIVTLITFRLYTLGLLEDPV